MTTTDFGPSEVRWNAPSRAAHPARDAAFRSYDAVLKKDKEAWLANFAADGWIEDPVGPSMFDEEGKLSGVVATIKDITGPRRARTSGT